MWQTQRIRLSPFANYYFYKQQEVVIKVCYHNDYKTEESSPLLGSAGGDCYLDALSEQLEFCNLVELFIRRSIT